MTLDDEIRHDINREPAKISALSSGQIDKRECLTVKKYYLLIKGK